MSVISAQIYFLNFFYDYYYDYDYRSLLRTKMEKFDAVCVHVFLSRNEFSKDSRAQSEPDKHSVMNMESFNFSENWSLVIGFLRLVVVSCYANVVAMRIRDLLASV